MREPTDTRLIFPSALAGAVGVECFEQLLGREAFGTHGAWWPWVLLVGSLAMLGWHASR